MKPRRVAMIAYHECPLASQEGKETGGMSIYVLELSKALAAQGVAVDVFTRSQDLHDNHIVEVMPNFRVIHVVAGPRATLSKKAIREYIPEFVDQFFEFIEQEKLTYDVLHCHYYLSGLVGLEIKQRGMKLPLVMNFHTLALMKNLVARTEAEMYGADRVDAELELVRQAQKILSPSESDRQYLEYLYEAAESKVAVIPPGVDTELFRPIDKAVAKQFIHADENHRIVLFVGRIEPLKGIDVLQYAIKILQRRNPGLDICLWIVGGDISNDTDQWSAELQKLEKMRHMLHISSTVKFVGQKPQTELPYYYNAAELAVMPSHYESFGMAAAEAMACGTPVITTNVTGVSNLLDKKHASLITSANNPLLLATQMELLLTDDVEHQQMSTAVYNKIQDLNWHDIAEEITAIYDQAYDDNL